MAFVCAFKICIHAVVVFYFSWISTRLRSQLSEKESDHAEALASAQAKYTSEIQNLKGLLASSEANNTDLQKEVRSEESESVCSISCVQS